MPCRLLRILATVASLIFLTTRPVLSQSVADFYRGKTIRLLVGYSSGGGHDANARLLSRFIGQYIPGNPSVVVENMPGASSLKSVQYLDGGGATDGTVFTAFNSGLVTESLTKPDQFPINLTNYSWIGSLSQEIRVCYVRAGTGIKTWNDLEKSQGIVFGETGRGSASYIDSGILREILGVKVKTILGYPGSAEKKLAVERGELDGDCVSFSSVPQDWIVNGKVNILSRGSTIILPDMPPDTPYIMDVTNDPQKKKLIKFLLSPSVVGRPFVASRAVPLDRVAALQQAFTASLKDSAFLAEADKLQLPVVGSMTGPEAADYMAEMYRVGPELVAAARRITGE